MFFNNAPANKAKNKNVDTSQTQLPKPKEVELIDFNSPPADDTTITDVECYPNYFEVGFKFIEADRYAFFELYCGIYSFNGVIVSFEFWRDALSFFLHRYLSVGFNTIYYDLPLILKALDGKTNAELKAFSNEIIAKRTWTKLPSLNHIDIMEVAPLHDGLKTYAGRIHAPRMQELPYIHYEPLSEEQVYYVRSYNVNDLDNTHLLYSELRGQIRLREKLGKRYGLDLRSKSDAQVAEAVIQSELNKLGIRTKAPTIQPGTTFYYQIPDFIKFKTLLLNQVLEAIGRTPFVINAGGKVNLPKQIAGLKIKIGETEYQLGIGGLHSKEESRTLISGEKILYDFDIRAFYPNIILNQRLYPAHLGEGFLTIYENLVREREQAKSNKDEDTNNSLKIAINGAFGKLGNEYSILYSPQLVMQVTISGQLSLLMLIERFEQAGLSVVSANTDGIVLHIPESDYTKAKDIISLWEQETNFVIEETIYKALYQRDVNNYLAHKTDDAFKEKGVFSERGSALNSVLSKNPETRICVEAVEAYLLNGVPLRDTITACQDIRKFVSVRKVEGGAQKNGQFLGKVIRWYYSENETGTINYVKTGNSVPKSEGAKPLMDLPETLPCDIDYARYVNISTEILFDLGYFKKAGNGSLFN